MTLNGNFLESLWSAAIGISCIVATLFFLLLFKWTKGLKRWIAAAFLGMALENACAAASVWFFWDINCTAPTEFIALRFSGRLVAIVALLLSMGAILFRNGDRKKV
jgi:hypothetical protein